MNEKTLRRQINSWIIFFIAFIFFNGVILFPLESELGWLHSNLAGDGSFAQWMERVYTGVSDATHRYPFLSYGTDWLAFSHLIIAILFIGPLIDPVKNSWIIDWGIISCLLALPVALIAGPIRQIPF